MKISVITPTLSSAKTLERAIGSVLDQGYENWEHIVVDGGSNDATIDILRRFHHLKWVSEKDNGQVQAMIKGFALSSGDIIVYLNADDYFLENAFDAVVKQFSAGAKVVVGNILVKSERTGTSYLNRPSVTFDAMLRHWLPDAYCYNSAGYFYLRQVQEACPFNAKNDVSMDLEFLLDVASRFELTKIEATLGCYVDQLDAKTHRSQSMPGFWKKENFPFIDRHIARWPEKDRLAFQHEREKGYIHVARYWKKMERRRKIFRAIARLTNVLSRNA